MPTDSCLPLTLCSCLPACKSISKRGTTLTFWRHCCCWTIMDTNLLLLWADDNAVNKWIHSYTSSLLLNVKATLLASSEILFLQLDASVVASVVYLARMSSEVIEKLCMQWLSEADVDTLTGLCDEYKIAVDEDKAGNTAALLKLVYWYLKFCWPR